MHLPKLRLNLVQLIFFPILFLVGIMGLSFWLRDLITLEWDITPLFANVLGWIITIFIVLMSCFVIFCIIKMFRIITKFVTVEQLERELNLIKSKN